MTADLVNAWNARLRAIEVIQTDDGYKLLDLPVVSDNPESWGVFLASNLVAALKRIEVLENEIAQMKGGK